MSKISLLCYAFGSSFLYTRTFPMTTGPELSLHHRQRYQQSFSALGIIASCFYCFLRSRVCFECPASGIPFASASPLRLHSPTQQSRSQTNFHFIHPVSGRLCLFQTVKAISLESCLPHPVSSYGLSHVQTRVSSFRLTDYTRCGRPETYLTSQSDLDGHKERGTA